MPEDRGASDGPSSPAIVLDTATFRTDRIARVTHALVDHPLLTLERVSELAASRPSHRVRWHLADIPVSSNFGRAAREHKSMRGLAETLRVIDQAESWVFIQHIEEEPAYRALVSETLGSIAQIVERDEPGMRDLHGWIFVSSPYAVTPYHMDHEANFLLQIRGKKTVNVWDARDRSVVGERELEAFHGTWSLDETKWRDELQAKANVFEVTPGTGVFMPFTSPHAVQNGDEVSITLSLTFLTDRSIREQRLFAANHKLRKLGLAPRPIGSSDLRDEAKVRAFQLWTNARGLARRTRAMLGGKSGGGREPSRY